MANLPAWSYSMLEMFSQCPKKAFHKYMLKEKEPETEAQRQGNLVDKALELRLKNDVPLPQEYAQHEKFIASLKGMNGTVVAQAKLGLRRDFTPCQFFDKDVWARAALDVLVTKKPWALIVDWKNGKNNESKPWYDGGLQRKIFTLFVLKFYPGLDKVTTFNVYLKDGEVGKPLVYTRDDQATLWKEILPKVIKIEEAYKKQEWPAIKGPLCSYCPVVTCNFHPGRTP